MDRWTGVSDQTENCTLFFIIRQGCRNLDTWTNLKEFDLLVDDQYFM